MRAARAGVGRGRHKVALCCALLALAGVADAERGDNLQPEDSPFSATLRSYDAELTRLLLDRGAREIVRAVFVPSRTVETAITLVEDEDGTAMRVVHAVPRRSIWGALQRTPGRPPEVVRHAAVIDDALATRIERAWQAMLSRTGYAGAPGRGLDGTTYHFELTGLTRQAERELRWSLAGKAWSPVAGSRVAALIELAEAMAALADAPPAERTARRAQLVERLAALEARLGAAR